MDISSLYNELNQFMDKLFSESDQQINLIIEEGTKDLELYLEAAAEKFKKKRKLKKTAVATAVDNEQKPLHFNEKENEPEPEFKRPTRAASKVATQKMKNNINMPLNTKLRRMEDTEGNYIIHNKQSVISNLNIKQERISEELDNCVEFGTSEFENLDSTHNLMKAIDEIVQSPSASLQIPHMTSLESNVERKPTILNGPPASLHIQDMSSLESNIEQKSTILNSPPTSSQIPHTPSVKCNTETKSKQNVGHQSNGSDKESKPENKSSSSNALSNVGSPLPVRVTRTKTRALANAGTLYSDLELCKENISSAKKCKNSTLQQTQNNGNQSSKVGMIVSHLESFITKQKPQHIPLATKQLEDALIREEKAAEAEKKKERLLKEKMENQKRINEAKQLRVQQAREQLEFQKQEKLRQLQMKKAEASKKQKELEHADLKEKACLPEHHKKDLGLAKTAAEQEVRDEKTKQEKVKPQAVMQKVQADLNVTYDASSCEATKPIKSNLFGVNDIYSGESSEEEEERMSKKIFPKWTLPEHRKRALRIQSRVPFEIVKEFIVSGEQTPDLTKIFQNVPKKALTRTSSAVWNTPPIHSFK